MANKTNSSNNFFETLVDAQQKAFDTMVENTKKLTNGNTVINEAIDKGTEFYKKTIDATKETMDKLSEHTSQFQNHTKVDAEKATEFFNHWKDQQIAWANHMQEINMNFLKNGFNTTNMQNPMSNWQNLWSQDKNNGFDLNAMANMMNPANFRQQMDKSMEQVKAFWGQFQSVLNNNYGDFAKNFTNGTLADTFQGMYNTSGSFAKFYEMWMPMMKSMQDKTFNMDVFSKNLNMDQFKQFMDKFFSFMPQPAQDYMNQMKEMYTETMKNGSNEAKLMMNSMKENMSNMMGNPYHIMLNNYNAMYGQMMNAVSPFAKLMTPTNEMKTMQDWAAIFHDMNVYNIKNAELQKMVYETGMKTMEKIAETTMHKIENGEDVSSMMKLYQEYLNTSDKMYVDLFETDEYSKLMSEVSTMKMQIKKAVEAQMEKSMVNIPVATRSEMDEVYQTIYDLKKLVRELQSKLDDNHTEAPVTKTRAPKAVPVAKAKATARPAAKKTGKRK